MKNIYKILSLFFAVAIIHGCGTDFLTTDYNGGKDEDTALDNVTNIELATTGLYSTFFNYRFAGNYAITIGDLAGDMAGFNFAASHWTPIFFYDLTDTDTYLENIWSYGYKIIDGAARVIKASNALIGDPATTAADIKTLRMCIADASALKGFATLYLTNIFGLPIKVNGTVDNSATLGVVAVEEPVEPFEKVERSTVAQCYSRIIADFERAIGIYTELEDLEEFAYHKNSNYLGRASVNGLLARTSLYMEDYDKAKTYAQTALDLFGGSMIYDPARYREMYQTTAANSESMFKLAITASDSWSANSSGTLWSTYGYQPNDAYAALLNDNDIRLFFLEGGLNQYGDFSSYGAKFLGENGNTAVATHFMVRMPEMYLIIAECELRSPQGTFANAQAALLNVAKRDLDIETTADLPDDEAGLLAFIEDERSRELFQEGHQFYDLRRLGKLANVSEGSKQPDFDIAKFCFPIPDTEVNSGFGVVQTEGWYLYLPIEP